MKPCHVLSMFLTFWHLKPYVLIWFVLIKKKRVVSFKIRFVRRKHLAAIFIYVKSSN